MSFVKKIFLLVSILILSCNSDDDTNPIESNCESQAIIDLVTFQLIQTGNYGINSVIINENCIEIKISSSGCDPNNWTMNFKTVPSTTAVSPHLFHAKVELINNEECLAVYEKTRSFDLTPLQIQGQNSIQLQIQGWNTPVIYNY